MERSRDGGGRGSAPSHQFDSGLYGGIFVHNAQKKVFLFFIFWGGEGGPSSNFFVCHASRTIKQHIQSRLDSLHYVFMKGSIFFYLKKMPVRRSNFLVFFSILEDIVTRNLELLSREGFQFPTALSKWGHE